MLKKTLCLLFCIATISLSAQEPAPENNSTAKTSSYTSLEKEYYWFSPHVFVGVPNPMNNKAFKQNFAGVYLVSAGMDISIFKGVFAGVGYTNATLKITGLLGTQNFHYSPLMKIDNGGIRVGAKTFIGAKNRIIYSASVMFGQTWTHYTDLRCKDSTTTPALTKYTASFIEPEMNLYFLIESNFSIGLTVSYSIYRKDFDPYEICLNEIKPVGPIGSGSTQVLSFGFCAYYSFLKKK